MTRWAVTTDSTTVSVKKINASKKEKLKLNYVKLIKLLFQENPVMFAKQEGFEFPQGAKNSPPPGWNWRQFASIMPFVV